MSAAAIKAQDVLDKLDQKAFGFFHVKMIIVSDPIQKTNLSFDYLVDESILHVKNSSDAAHTLMLLFTFISLS
jgi:hypothetical protein